MLSVLGGRLTLGRYKPYAPKLQEIKNPHLEAVGVVKDKSHRPKMVSLVLKPMIPNLDLTPNIITTSKCNPINQFGISWSVLKR